MEKFKKDLKQHSRKKWFQQKSNMLVPENHFTGIVILLLKR